VNVILHFFPVAPNPTKVRLYIAEKENAGAALGIEESLVNLQSGEQNSPEHLARNPLGKLPALELDGGGCLCESLAIIEFLEELHPEPTMIGRDPRERASVRELERICDIGVLISIARWVHATRSPLGLPASPEIAENAREAMKRPLWLLDDRLADGRSFVAGPRPTVADCTLAAALQFGRFGGLALDPSLENLHEWDRRFRERASARAVLVT
jgi:glutathione S-transferase